MESDFFYHEINLKIIRIEGFWGLGCPRPLLGVLLGGREGREREFDFARKAPLPTANLHAMVKFGGVLLAVVVVVVAGPPACPGEIRGA